MRRIFLWTLIIWANISLAQIPFSKKYSFIGTVKRLPDQSLMLIGEGKGHGPIGPLQGGDLYIAHLDSNASFIWEKYYGGQYNENVYDFLVDTINQGNIVVCASSKSYEINGFTQFLFINTDFNGDTIWTSLQGSSLGLIDGGEPSVISKMLDGNYVSAGSNGTCYVVKLNYVNGDTLWTRSFTNGNLMYGLGVSPALDSGAYICGGILINNDADLFVLKLDINGNLQWCKVYGNSLASRPWKMRPTQNGGIVIVGDNDASQLADIIVVNLDVNGDTLWTRQFDYANNEEHGNDIQQNDDGSFIVCGSTKNYINGQFN